jgi:hypothetical protein
MWLAFQAGYRTAFVSSAQQHAEQRHPKCRRVQNRLPDPRPSADDTRLRHRALGRRGLQAALLDANIALMVRAVFTVGSPHQEPSADWAFGADRPRPSPADPRRRSPRPLDGALPADPLGRPRHSLLSRVLYDPNRQSVTGPVLASLTQGQPNDGIVTVARSRLPPFYAVDLGTIPANHFALAMGSLVFPRINAQIQALEGSREFERIATGGFAFDGEGNPLPGDRQNSFPWSTQWFKGAAVARPAFSCVTSATNDAALGGQLPAADTRHRAADPEGPAAGRGDRRFTRRPALGARLPVA